MLKHLILKAIGLLKPLPQKSERIPFKGGGWAKREGCPYFCEKWQKGASGRSECWERQRLSRTHTRASDFVVAVAPVGASSPRVLQNTRGQLISQLGLGNFPGSTRRAGAVPGAQGPSSEFRSGQKACNCSGSCSDPSQMDMEAKQEATLGLCSERHVSLLSLAEKMACGWCWLPVLAWSPMAHAGHTLQSMRPSECLPVRALCLRHLPCLSRSSVLESFLSLCLSLWIWSF